MNKLLIPFLKIAGLYILVGFVVRIILIFLPITDNSFFFTDYLKIFFIGIVNDLCISVIAYIFLFLHVLFLSNSKYKSPYGYIILSLFILILIYLFFFKNIFNDYGSVVPTIVRSFVGIKAFSFALLLFFPALRQKWRYGAYSFMFFLYVFLIIFNAVSEFLFWNEFGVRYNFIAVDYLIYTNEVIGNILESYPIIPMMSILILASIIITVFFIKNSLKNFIEFPTIKAKLTMVLVYLIMLIGSLYIIKLNVKFENSDNLYVNELQANGLYRFYKAYDDSSLSYDKFYAQMPIDKAFELMHQEYNNLPGRQNTKVISDTIAENKKNIILVTIESMSASYLSDFGNEENLTPYLDQLYKDGISFTNMYATGNRTVRGLEAVTLCIPPSPGESLVKRNNNDNLFSTGYLLKEKGYTVQYFYGGYSYFDNMQAFFGGNNYQLIDRSAFTPEEITFANIWGVCDGDMFKKAIKVFDLNARENKPFFGHIMTVSNHRPFTYPDGEIDIPSDSKSREGGVKYTDYAIGKFMEEAKKHSWYSNTIFVFVSDHCASSAGKVDIPLERYHIPAVIYAPGFVQSQKVTKLTSQIDVMPTVFGLLNFTYTSHFYGQDVFKPDYKPRALIATYQNLGYLENNILTVLSPKQKIEQFDVKEKDQLEKRKDIDKALADKAVANYQTSAYLIDNGMIKVNK